MTVPSLGWTGQTVAKEGNGYIVHIKGSYDGRDEYVRLSIYDCKYDMSGNVVGVYVKYQKSWKPEE